MRNSKGISFGFWPTFAISAGPTASKYTEVHYKKSQKCHGITNPTTRREKEKEKIVALGIALPPHSCKWSIVYGHQ